MNRTPDVELVLREYLAEDGLTAPDYVLDVVEQRIGRQPRRRRWRLTWRLNPMNRTVLYAASLAAVLVVVVVGYTLLPRQGAVGNAPTSSPSPRATSVQSLPDRSLAPGSYLLRPLTSAPLSIEATAPDGWQSYGGFALLGPKNTDAPDGIGIGFIAAQGLFSDPCHWDLAGNHSWPQAGDIVVGPTVVDITNALVANKAYVSTTPTDAVLGAYTGRRLDLQLPSDIARCDKDSSGESRYMVFSGADAGLYAQGPAWRMHLTIVDVNGTRLIAVVGDYAGTSDADRKAAQAILDSLVIRP